MDRRIIISISFNTIGFSDSRRSEDWIRDRLEIFQNYTLKSLRHQNNQDFITFVEYDKSTEPFIFSELKKYQPLPANVIFVDSATPHICREIRNYKYLYLVRLDSDDMFCKTFISQLHAYKPKKDTLALINQEGFIYDAVNKRLGEYYDDSPPFYTLIYKTEDYLKGIRYKLPNGHLDVIKLPHEILPKNNYLVTVHSKNTTTIFNSYHTKNITDNNLKVNQILHQYFSITDSSVDNKAVILMYHYVKAQNPLKIERYDITSEVFEKQVEYFSENYKIISPDDFLQALDGRIHLPEKSLLLTFDDGYIDHYQNVFPILAKRNIKAFFFPCAKPVLEGGVLITNKVQFILDFAKDRDELFSEFIKILKEPSAIKSDSEAKLLNEIISKKDKGGFLSTLERNSNHIGFSNLIDRLYKKYVPYNEKELSGELYMNIRQLKEMKDYGMHIGCHSYNHYWMSSLKPAEQIREIERSLELLRRINGSKRNWVMCYPYGVVNNSLIDIIKARGCIAGFTTAGGQANLSKDQKLTLPRCNITKF